MNLWGKDIEVKVINLINFISGYLIKYSFYFRYKKEGNVGYGVVIILLIGYVIINYNYALIMRRFILYYKG